MKIKFKKKVRVIATICLAMIFLCSIFFAIKASADQTVFKLTSVSVLEKSNDVVASIDDFDADDIKLNLEFHKLDDYVIYKLIIKNTSNHDYTLTSLSDTNTNEFIKYEYDKHENELIKAGDSLEVSLKAIYKNEQTDITKRDQNENFKLLFSFINENGEPVDGNIDINPKTSDNIYIYYIIAGASLLGIAVLNIKFKNNKAKTIIITLILLTPIVVKAVEPSFSITFKGDSKLYDKLIVKYLVNGDEVTKVVKYGEKADKPADPQKDGYTFAGWYLNGEPYDFSKPVKLDENLEPRFTPNPTTYTVNHKYENLNGSFTTESKSVDAVTDEEVTAPIISKTGFNDPTPINATVKFDGSTTVTYEYLRKTFDVSFNAKGGTSVNKLVRKYEEELGTLPSTSKDNYIFDNWYTLDDGGVETTALDKITSNTTYYARWKKSAYFAELENENFNIIRGNTAQINITNISEIGENISYESNNTNVATVNSNGLITASGKGSAVITIKGLISNKTKEVIVNVKNENVAVHFNTHGGSEVNDVTVENETAIGSKIPASPTKDYYLFDDWYTTESGSTKVTSETIINGETTFHVKWKKSVYFAEIENSNIDLIRGNNSQINITNIDEIGENIIYSSSNNNVATVSSTGIISAVGKGSAVITVKGSISNVSKEINVSVVNENVTVSFNSHGGSDVSDVTVENETAIGNKIPSAPIREHYIFDDWYTTETGSTKVTSETIVDGDTTYHAKWNKSLYFATLEKSGISLLRNNSEQINITNINEIAENVTYTSSNESVASVSSTGVVTANTKGTAIITIEGVISHETKEVSVSVANEGVPVHFNTHGGSLVDDVYVEDATAIGSNIPAGPTKDHYLFDDWYTTDSYTTKVTSETVINGETTFHANYNKTVYFAEIENTNVNLIREETSQINITNSSEISENIVYETSNSNVATVDSNGLITATGKGTTTIIVKGETSLITKEVTVTVANENVTVDFNTHGGTGVSSVTLEKGTTLDSLPTTIKEHYIFDNWYTSDSYETLVDISEPINGNVEFHANWKNSVYQAIIENLNVDMVRGNTSQISITNIASIGENITYESNNNNIATVDGNGLITATGKGSAVITIKGATSNETKDINVSVVNENVLVHFNTHGGSDVSDVTIENETAIGSKIPAGSTKEHYLFDDWYTTDNYTTKVTTETVINGETTFHANYNKSVYFAEIENINVNLIKTNTSQINITNSSEIGENIVYETSNSNVATVDSNGLITATGKGSATITVKGATSNEEKAVTVNVSNQNVLVHFDSHGGTTVSDVEVEDETAIGNKVPAAPTKEHFIFDDWYTTDSYTTKVTTETVISGETTLHANWNNSVYQANIVNSSIELTKNSSEQINISNISTIGENIIYESSDDSIASVDENGLISADSKGTAVITVKGATSNETKEVSVTVRNENVTVSFNTHGGTAVSDIQVEDETEIGDRIPSGPTREHFIFDDWYTTDSYETKVDENTIVNGNTTYHANWDKSVYHLEIENDNITLPKDGTGSIVINNASEIGEAYVFTSSDSSKVTVDDEGNLTALDVTTTPVTIFIEGSLTGEERTVSVSVTAQKYTVSFNTHTSETISSIEVNAGSTLSSIPEPTNEGKTFEGWFYNEDGTGGKLTTSTIINESHEYHAVWSGIICKKATSLHTETCNQTSTSKYCSGNGHSKGDTITYGNIINSDTYAPGDAFDCDVDGSGYNQRFYYIRTIDDKAVLINNMNFTAASGQSDQNTSGIYTWALNQLPTTTQWSNLPVTFSGSAARLITQEDLLEMAGKADINDLRNNWTLGSYEFLFENSNYSGIHERSTQWIVETSAGVRARYRNDSGNVAVLSSKEASTSKNPVRPVIEVPLDQIEDSYILKFIFGNDPSSTNYAYQKVSKGSKIGTLPTYPDANYIVLWYKDPSLTNKISENTIPQGYETYYSEWKLKASQAIYATTEFKLSNGTTSTIVVLNSEDVEPLTYTSNDESIVTVDNEGIITAHSVGETTITVEGAYSHITQTLHVNVSADTPKVTVSFNTHGGTPVDDIELDINTSIGEMPTSTKDGNTLVGWYNDEEYSIEIKGDNEILADVTLHAKWMPSDTVCEMNNNYYSNIQTAIDQATTTKTTIKLLTDVTLSSMIDMVSKNQNKDIVLDLNGHNITTINTDSNSKFNVIKTSGKIEVKNGSLTTNSPDAVIDIESGGVVVVDSVNITNTKQRGAIYNNGGTATIKGNSYFTSNANGSISGGVRATVQNVAGKVTILSGTIVNNHSSNAHAIYAKIGSVTIGTKDGVSTTDAPIIIGNTYGVKIDSGANIFFYDGIIKAVTDVFENTVIPNTNIEEGYEQKTGILQEADKTYNIFYLSSISEDYKIQFNVDGGTVDPLFINVTPGDSVSLSDLPTPTKGIYTFDGWYLDENAETTPVVYPYIPDSNTVFYAKWIYAASDEIINFDMISDAMRVYYNNISTWKDLDKATFQSNMLANFNAKTCSKCNGDNACGSPLAGNLCEQTKGYDTGVSDEVLVYESSEANKEKGSLVSYTTSTDGVIYNMIPGKVYYWESSLDSQIHGYVKAQGERRTIKSSARNVRDLGGMATSFTRNNATKTGTVKYGKLFRGAQLSGGQTDVNSILKLGVTREIDLRAQTEGNNPVRLPKHDKCDSNCSSLTSSQDIIIDNYIIYPDNQYPDLNNPGTYKNCPVVDGKTCNDNFVALRQTMVDVMNYIISGDNIYFHCTIGTDRTGTIAYFLEGLLGVSEEDRVEDYELSYFYGMVNRDRYHDYLAGSSRNPRFTTMYKTYDTNEKIYDWFMYGLSDEEKADMNTLIENFRDAMIDYN